MDFNVISTDEAYSMQKSWLYICIRYTGFVNEQFVGDIILKLARAYLFAHC